jgi:hypothetical protein
LIDITISAKDDITNIKNYTLYNNNNYIDIYSYDFDSFIQDLMITIESSKLPWKHYKYIKRMERLILLLLIDLKSKDPIYNILKVLLNILLK